MLLLLLLVCASNALQWGQLREKARALGAGAQEVLEKSTLNATTVLVLLERLARVDETVDRVWRLIDTCLMIGAATLSLVVVIALFTLFLLLRTNRMLVLLAEQSVAKIKAARQTEHDKHKVL